jgi:hypothetical protein
MRVAVDELYRLVDEEARRVEVVRELGLFTVRKPIGLVVDREVGLLLPIIGATVGEDERPLESPLARK